MKESVNLHIEEVYFIRQKWAASVIANVLKKNCEFRKRERMMREQKEKERKRKLEEERKRKMEEEEKNRSTEKQLEKDKEKAAGVGTMFLIQHYRKEKGVDPGKCEFIWKKNCGNIRLCYIIVKISYRIIFIKFMWF